MSGIAGIYNLDGRPVDPAVLTRMTGAMAHRGPDGAGQYTDGPVGLGHRMLHTTPESLRDKQPLLDETGNLCLVLDGRVDNREELRAALEAQGATLRTDTDAEMVLRAYQCWGEECPKKILGDFAFVISDRQNRLLLGARDPLGIKPLYYHSDSQTFLFASEMQPLFEGPTLPRRPNLPLIGLYLEGRYDEREETLYEGVYRLPSAHCLILKGGTVRKTQYWDIDPDHTIRYRTDAEYAEHFLCLFQEAVRCRLRAHGAVGAWLSGGLDSSSIVCTAQMLYERNIVPANGFETFSVIFDELPCDERSYVEEVVRKCGVSANFVTYEKQDLSTLRLGGGSQYPDVLYGSFFLTYANILRGIAPRRINVFLDGTGGDELLAAGFDHLTDLLRQGSFLRLVRQVRHDASIYGVTPWSLVVDYCLKPFIPRPVKTVLKSLLIPSRRNGFSPLVKPEFIKEKGLEQRAKAAISVRKFPTRSQQVIYNGLFFGWNPIVAAEMNELFTARFSVESRYPFLDRRVVEFLLAVPEEQRWRADEPKIVLRQAMRGILPEAIRSRKQKTEYSPQIDWELKDRQADEVERLFRTARLASLGVIDTDHLLQLFEQYRRGTRRYLTGVIELIVGLELWCRYAVGTFNNSDH